MQITHLILQTHALNAQRDFYANMLGLSLLAASDQQFTVQAGATALTFVETLSATHPNYHFAFNIPPEQLDDALVWLTSRVSLVANDTGATRFNGSPLWDARMAYFYDPAGNIVEFIGRNRLHNDASASFSSSSIMRISEIGLATDDVQALVQTLNTHLNIPVMDGKDSDMFAATGDDHGMFIVVRKGRIWFPTRDHQAIASPLQVSILGSRDSQLTTNDGQYSITMTAQ